MSEKTIVSDDGKGTIRYSDGSLTVNGLNFIGECTWAEWRSGASREKFKGRRGFVWINPPASVNEEGPGIIIAGGNP